MLAILTVLVLAGTFTCMFAMMWVLQRHGGVRRSALPAPRPMPPPRPVAPPLGPDDDPAFLRELRRRIDRGHFRR
jgi:hypothetical protein